MCMIVYLDNGLVQDYFSEQFPEFFFYEITQSPPPPPPPPPPAEVKWLASFIVKENPFKHAISN